MSLHDKMITLYSDNNYAVLDTLHLGYIHRIVQMLSVGKQQVFTSHMSVEQPLRHRMSTTNFLPHSQ